jgi:hypothetical protein
MLERSGRPAAPVPDDKMEALFQAELDKCQSWLAAQQNFKVLYVDYRDMLMDPTGKVRIINRFLGDGLDVEAMAAVVDPDLYRNRNGPHHAGGR